MLVEQESRDVFRQHQTESIRTVFATERFIALIHPLLSSSIDVHQSADLSNYDLLSSGNTESNRVVHWRERQGEVCGQFHLRNRSIREVARA